MKSLSVLSLANEQMVKVKLMTSELIHVEIFFFLSENSKKICIFEVLSSKSFD